MTEKAEGVFLGFLRYEWMQSDAIYVAILLFLDNLGSKTATACHVEGDVLLWSVGEREGLLEHLVVGGNLVGIDAVEEDGEFVGSNGEEQAVEFHVAGIPIGFASHIPVVTLSAGGDDKFAHLAVQHFHFVIHRWE